MKLNIMKHVIQQLWHCLSPEKKKQTNKHNVAIEGGRENHSNSWCNVIPV